MSIFYHTFSVFAVTFVTQAYYKNIISYFVPHINTKQIVTKVTDRTLLSCYNKAEIKAQGGYKMSIFNVFARKDINEGVRSFRESKNAILLDVRTREEYASGHIEGSRNLPLDEIDKVDSVIKDKNTPLYIHCLSGGRSARAAAYLKGKGYREGHDIGGIGSYRGKIVV